jgi:hypothetical protein
MRRILTTIAAILLLQSVAHAQITPGPNIAVFLNRANVFTLPQTITVSGLAVTPGDGLIIQNGTAATVGTTVQMSPLARWCGAAWNSSGAASETDCFKIDVLPVTVAGTTTAGLQIAVSINGGAYVNELTLSSAGVVTATSSVVSGSNVQSAAGSRFYINGRGGPGASADKQFTLTDNGATTGAEINGGTPTLGTCTGGSLTSGSHNFAGEITGNTSGSCALNFGTPNFINTPICFAMSRTSTTHPRISASSTSAITITGGVSGEAIGYHCDGRIGT